MEPKYSGQPGQQDQLGQQLSSAGGAGQPFRPATTPTKGPVISDFMPSRPLSPALQPKPAETTLRSTYASPHPNAAPAPTGSPLQPSSPAAQQPIATPNDAIGPQPSAPVPAETQHTSFAKPTPPDVSPKEKPADKSAFRDILSIAGVLGSALLLAFCLISFVFQSYQVDGPSMQTTLENNDHLIVWKVPKTIANITNRHYIPNRGDVIIFNEPVNDGIVENKQLIKRVMALPGERVTVKDGILTVYNQENPEGFQPDKTLPYGNVITTTPGNVDVTVGVNQVFVCGDNRTNSLDSRIFGPVDSDRIVGKLVVRVLPLNTVKAF